MLIYKIFRQNEWADLVAQGQTAGAPIDLIDGYIHFSTAETLRETASKHFAGAQGLILAIVESDKLTADLKWEVSRGGAEFPHLYRDLKLDEVISHSELELRDGAHVFAEGIA